MWRSSAYVNKAAKSQLKYEMAAIRKLSAKAKKLKMASAA
jgi:hypothetical protein